jgi:hypothetical protein
MLKFFQKRRREEAEEEACLAQLDAQRKAAQQVEERKRTEQMERLAQNVHAKAKREAGAKRQAEMEVPQWRREHPKETADIEKAARLAILSKKKYIMDFGVKSFKELVRRCHDWREIEKFTDVYGLHP